MLTKADLQKLKVVELKDELTKLGLPTKGLKAELVNRLFEHHSSQEAAGEGEATAAAPPAEEEAAAPAPVEAPPATEEEAPAAAAPIDDTPALVIEAPPAPPAPVEEKVVEPEAPKEEEEEVVEPAAPAPEVQEEVVVPAPPAVEEAAPAPVVAAPEPMEVVSALEPAVEPTPEPVPEAVAPVAQMEEQAAVAPVEKRKEPEASAEEPVPQTADSAQVAKKARMEEEEAPPTTKLKEQEDQAAVAPTEATSSPAKQEISPLKEKGTEVYVYGGLTVDTKEEELRAIFAAVGEVIGINIKTPSPSRVYAFVKYSNAAAAQKAIADLNGVAVLNGKSLQVSATSNNDRLCLFNLPYEFNQDAVKKSLMEQGVEGVVNVDMNLDEGGRNRGQCTVEFDATPNANKAFSQFSGGKIIMNTRAIRAEWPKGDALQVKNVFIGGVPADVQEEELRAIFSPFGEIQQVKLAGQSFNSGRTDFAFVDFVNRNSAIAAVEGLRVAPPQVRGHVLNVQMARPPQRRNNDNNRSSYGGGRSSYGNGGGYHNKYDDRRDSGYYQGGGHQSHYGHGRDYASSSSGRDSYYDERRGY